MKVIISSTGNGAWISIRDKTDPDFKEEDYSYQFDVNDRADSSLAGLAEMLWELLERMGWSGDRRDRERIQVRVVHGDKFAHTEASGDRAIECRICKELAYEKEG